MKVLRLVDVRAHQRGIYVEDPTMDGPGLFGQDAPVAAPPAPAKPKTQGCARCFPLEARVEELKAQVRRLMENAAMPSARSSDPATSKEAAKWAARAADGVTGFRRKVLEAFLSGPLTDDGAWRRLTAREGHEIPKASVAKRRLELQRMGYIEAVGEQSRIPSGAKGLIWRLTSAGERAAY